MGSRRQSSPRYVWELPRRFREVLAPARATFGTSGTANPQVNTYNGDVWSNLPFLQLLQGQIGIGDFNKVGNVGTNVYSLQNGENNPAPYLPAPITNNIARLNAIRANRDAWELANGLYRAGNRDLESEYAVAARPWQSPTGMESMQVRTR